MKLLARYGLALVLCTMLVRCQQPAPEEALNSELTAYDQKMHRWKEATFGMFIHWGVWANLAGYWHGKHYKGYSEHIFRQARIPVEDYKQEVLGEFNPEQFDAEAWVKLCQTAGMKYLVFTAKHHDGVAMYDSEVSYWGEEYDVVDGTPWGRDPLMELKQACKKHGIMFGIYYSHAQDWSHPFGQRNTWDFNHPNTKFNWFDDPAWADHRAGTAQYVEEKSIPQLKELLTRYEPEIIWFDTKGWIPEEFNQQIVQVVKDSAPQVVINNRSANGMADYIATGDKPLEFIPVNHPYWEAIPTTNESYGYHQGDSSHKPPIHFVQLLSKATARGGNLLMNIGPKGNGEVDPIDIGILTTIGSWLKQNGEAIYGFRKTMLPKQSWGETTMNANKLYLHVHTWPQDQTLILSGLASKVKQAYALADKQQTFDTERLDAATVKITIPQQPLDDMVSVIVVETKGPIQVNDTSFVITPKLTTNTLHAFYGNVKGSGLSYGSGAPHRNYVHHWRDPETYIEWPIKTYEAGRYTLGIVYDASERESAPENSYTVQVGEQTFQANVILGNGFEEIELGEVELPTGISFVTLKIANLKSKGLMQFRSLTLKPI